MSSPTLCSAPAASAATILALPKSGFVVRAVTALLEWNDRYRQRIHLGQLDERQLRDIGLTRNDAGRESDKPFWRG